MRTDRKTVPTGDIEIACTIVGEGTPLVVLHGAIGLGSTYMRALDQWGDELQLIHYDQRGSGDTPVGDVQRVSFAGGVEDLEGLRDHLGLGRIQVLGHSAGAYLAALYAAEHPAATAGVVLLNSGPPLAPDLMKQFGK
ncbi:MAG: alpha/beta fold hydrolase, partial [Actinomycetes bacterium]